MIDELVAGMKKSLETRPEDSDRKFYGVVVGTVLNPVDPFLLGRVQVRTPFIDSLDLAPWARICQSMAGPIHGTYFIPNLNDEVLLAFEHGDVNAPYVLGSLANMVNRPALPSPLPQVRSIRTIVGNQIVFTEAPPTITLQNGPTPPLPAPAPPLPPGPYQTVMLSPAGVDVVSGVRVTIQVGPPGAGPNVTITPAGIVMQMGATVFALTTAGITMQGPIITEQATGQVGIFAPQVRINS